jgi:hypothetical protein
LETNVKRLLSAVLDERARPSPEVRSETLSMLANLVHAQRTVFPESILRALGFLVLLGILWWSGSVVGLKPTNVPPALLYMLQLLGMLNVLVSPFAGLVMFIRRRSSNVPTD